MIGVDGQYQLEFSIKNLPKFKDFIIEESLVKFLMIEETGNFLPTFELEFKTQDETIFSVLNDGNDIQVKYGISKNDVSNTSIVVTGIKSVKTGKQRIINIKGVFSAIPYLTTPRVRITEKISAVEAIRNVASANFGSKNIISNIETSSDHQRWIQPRQTDRKFVSSCWMYSYIPDSFIAVAISSDGKFIIKDIMKDIGAGDSTVSYRFITVPKGPKDIAYIDDPVIETNTGFLNNWIGYGGRDQLVYDMDSAMDDELVSEETKIMTAVSKGIAQRIEAENKYVGTGFQNENVHANYSLAFQRNLGKLASFGNVKATVSFSNNLKPIRVLDKVIFLEPDSLRDNQASSEYLSGIYYVAKVARCVANRRLLTTVVLCREAMNSIKVTT